MTELSFSIGALSKRTGCSTETIRYYERIGLIANPPRTEGGHRIYAECHSKRLRFIRRSRGLGFTLEQVRQLLSLIDGDSATCEQVKSITVEHLDEVRQKIADLRTLEDALASMSAECTGGEVRYCPVVETLFEAQPG